MNSQLVLLIGSRKLYAQNLVFILIAENSQSTKKGYNDSSSGTVAVICDFVSVGRARLNYNGSFWQDIYT